MESILIRNSAKNYENNVGIKNDKFLKLDPAEIIGWTEDNQEIKFI